MLETENSIKRPKSSTQKDCIKSIKNKKKSSIKDASLNRNFTTSASGSIINISDNKP